MFIADDNTFKIEITKEILKRKYSSTVLDSLLTVQRDQEFQFEIIQVTI